MLARTRASIVAVCEGVPRLASTASATHPKQVWACLELLDTERESHKARWEAEDAAYGYGQAAASLVGLYWSSPCVGGVCLEMLVRSIRLGSQPGVAQGENIPPVVNRAQPAPPTPLPSFFEVISREEERAATKQDKSASAAAPAGPAASSAATAGGVCHAIDV